MLVMRRKRYLNVRFIVHSRSHRLTPPLHFSGQFADKNLRQFNLIGIDMRGSGATEGVIGETTFTPTDSAADVEQIMVREDDLYFV